MQLSTESMNIFAEKGTKVEFKGEGGYDYQIEDAKQHLELGKIYTIDSTIIGGWETSVSLEEIPCLKFNSVMFAEVH